MTRLSAGGLTRGPVLDGPVKAGSPKPPADVATYVEILGVDLAVEFFCVFGGAELYLPERPLGRSEAEALIGADRMQGMAAFRHRLPRRVPLANTWLAHVLRHQGWTAARIARTLRISDVSVRRMLKGSTVRGSYRRQKDDEE